MPFVIRRLLLGIPVLLGVVSWCSSLARVIPGDPCAAALGERATQADVRRVRARYGLDQPIPTQFGIYLGQLVRGDLGDSHRSRAAGHDAARRAAAD